MKNLIIILFLFLAQAVASQKENWKKLVVDSNLTIEMPGRIDTLVPTSMEGYNFRAFSTKTDSTVLFAQVGTSKDPILIDNRQDYLRAMELMVKGALKSAEEKNWKAIVSDITCDGVPGKKMSYIGKMFNHDVNAFSHLFLVNGLSYNLGIMFYKTHLSVKDSSTLTHFISSIDFPVQIREKQFMTKAGSVAYRLGRLVSLLLIGACIVFIIIYVVRRI